MSLDDFLRAFKPVSDLLIDAYFVVDRERTIIEFNSAFYALLPRAVARGLRGRKCHEVLDLEVCRERCVAETCWREGRHVRLDEIGGISHEMFLKTSQSYELLMQLRLVHQQMLHEEGLEPDNFIDPQTLSELERTTLKEALAVVNDIKGYLREAFHLGSA
jgi:PAS domain-containing protein